MKNLILLLFILTGCSNDYPIFSPQPGYIFPLTVGNQWDYVYTYSLINYPEQGDTFFFSDTVHWEITGKRSIERWNTYILEEDYLSTYYANLEDGFYQIAYSISNPPLSHYPHKQGYRIRFKGRTFNNIKELEMWIMKLGNPFKRDTVSLLDSLTNDIRKMLSYPPEIGDKWTFFTYPWYAVREIVAIEEVNTEIGEFACWKSRTLYDLDNDGLLDQDFYWDDYYSEIGIIKRYFFFLIEFVNENGIIIGEGKSETVMLLKDYSIIFP